MMARWFYTLSIGLLLGGLALVVWSAWQWRQGILETERITALQHGKGAAIESGAGPRLRLAWAVYLLGKQRYEDALDVFSDLLTTAPPHLLPWVYYNLGNLYLRRAQRQVEQTAFDEAMPLVALAKQSYRQVLRLKPDFWPARYNLEASIRLMPEIEQIEMKRKEGKETAEEALWTRVPGFPRGLP